MRLTLLILLAAGCLKPQPPVQAATSAPVLVAMVLESFDEDALGVAPAEAVDRIDDEVSRRNLQPQAADPASYAASFASVRATEARVEALAGFADTPVVLLVEAAPRFSAQVNGRYRWSVETTVTLLPTSAPEERVSDVFTVPVHLVYSHEKEPEALTEAAPVVARHVGRLLDDWIGAGAP